MFSYSQFPTEKEIFQDKNNKSDDVIEISGVKYLLAMFLDDGITVSKIPINQITSLELEDNLFGLDSGGRITYNNKNFALHKTINSLVGFVTGDRASKCVEEKTGKEEFVFRGDGYTLLHIKFQAIYNGDETLTVTKPKKPTIMHTYGVTKITDSGNPFSDKTFTLEFMGIERFAMDMFTGSRYKCGLLAREFEHVDGIISGETNIPEYLPSGDRDYSSADSRTFKADQVGHALHRIMNRSIIYYLEARERLRANNSSERVRPATYSQIKAEYDFLPKLKVVTNTVNTEIKTHARHEKFLSKGRTDDNTDFPLIGQVDLWEMGSPNNVYWTTSEANITLYDIYKRFNRLHLGFGGMPVITKLTRPYDGNTKSMVTSKTFTTYHDELYNLENGDGGDGFMGDFMFFTPEIQGDARIPRALSKFFGCDKVSTAGTGAIKNFSFNPIKPEDSIDYFKTHKTTNIALNKGKVNVYKYSDMKTKIENFLLRNFGSDYIFNVDATPEKDAFNNALNFQFKMDTEVAADAHGQKRLLSSMILLNDSLIFTDKGNIGREAGMFLRTNIDATANKDDETLNRLLGVYWVTNLTHTINIKERTYTNLIEGVKYSKKKI